MSRLALYGPFVLLAIFILAWSVAWSIGARRVGEVFDGFVAREASRGRDWICPERSITGFPFRLELSCVKPQFVERFGNGGRREATMAGLSIHGRITSPGHYIASFTAPMGIRVDADRDLTPRRIGRALRSLARNPQAGSFPWHRRGAG
jgi:hypothetical protein